MPMDYVINITFMNDLVPMPKWVLGSFFFSYIYIYYRYDKGESSVIRCPGKEYMMLADQDSFFYEEETK